MIVPTPNPITPRKPTKTQSKDRTHRLAGRRFAGRSRGHTIADAATGSGRRRHGRREWPRQQQRWGGWHGTYRGFRNCWWRSSSRVNDGGGGGGAAAVRAWRQAASVALAETAPTARPEARPEQPAASELMAEPGTQTSPGAANAGGGGGGGGGGGAAGNGNTGTIAGAVTGSNGGTGGLGGNGNTGSFFVAGGGGGGGAGGYGAVVTVSGIINTFAVTGGAGGHWRRWRRCHQLLCWTRRQWWRRWRWRQCERG